MLELAHFAFCSGIRGFNVNLRPFLPVAGLFLILIAFYASQNPNALIAVPAEADEKGGGNEAVSTTDPCNARLAVQVASNARFNIGAYPEPLSCGATSGSWDIMYRWPNSPRTSFTTIRVDGVDNIYGSSGIPVEPPNDIDANTNRSKWQIGGIEITQTLQLADNPQTGLQDVAQISYTVTNTGSSPHTAGVRMMIDTELNYNDGAPFRVPGVGPITTEMDFVGASVPDTFQVFYNLTDSEHVAAATLKSGGATSPDRFIIAQWPEIWDTFWDYTITPGARITSDSAYAVYWNPITLAPGASRTYTTFYGLAELDVDLLPPLALGVSGPAELSVIGGQYSPNPFNVVATIFNNGNATATDVEVTVNLPAGLSLESGSLTQSIGNLPVGEEHQISWSVRASAQSSETTLTYSVTATASNAEPKTVERDLFLPFLQLRSDLTITKTDSPDPARLGSILTYTVTVINKGTAPAVGVVMRDTLPSATAFPSMTTTKGNCSRSLRTINCNIGDLAPGERAVITIKVRVMVSGTLSNTAVVDPDGLIIEIDESNNSATANTLVSSISLSNPTLTDRKVIFIQGIDSESGNFDPVTGNTDCSQAGFIKDGSNKVKWMVNYLTTSSWVRLSARTLDSPEDFFYFSYSGFYCKLSDGSNKNDYQKPRYVKADTCDGVKGAAGKLQVMMTDLVSMYPSAKFDIIAHSMGGLVATQWLSDNPQMQTKVNSVVTFDSPLRGIPDRLLNLLTVCPTTSSRSWADLWCDVSVGARTEENCASEFVRNTSIANLGWKVRFYTIDATQQDLGVEYVPGDRTTLLSSVSRVHCKFDDHHSSVWERGHTDGDPIACWSTVIDPIDLPSFNISRPSGNVKAAFVGCAVARLESLFCKLRMLSP